MGDLQAMVTLQALQPLAAAALIDQILAEERLEDACQNLQATMYWLTLAGHLLDYSTSARVLHITPLLL